ncbi:hypothetical protein PTTG_29431 [Puccinia triticina 1-1 BBBD Race 1]|uniref:Uncharacterized protein n=1 Tax=Puccinia triticina (isolate 1-1 / race 1 (BBBD)) TaxID=630390 RepID=A0A180G4C2_PUCT1|nr:hypothetical protein PTTG_29431 [Puccinia triticina 1-1 BBBD Race 1]
MADHPEQYIISSDDSASTVSFDSPYVADTPSPVSDDDDPYSYHNVFMASSNKASDDNIRSDDDDQDLDVLAAHAAIDDHFDNLESDMLNSSDQDVNECDNNTSNQSDILVPLFDETRDSSPDVEPYQAYPGSPRGFPRYNYADYTVETLVDPRLRYNPFCLFPRHQLPTFPPARPPMLPRQMFEASFRDLTIHLENLLTRTAQGHTVYNELNSVEFILNVANDWYYVYQAFEHGVDN